MRYIIATFRVYSVQVMLRRAAVSAKVAASRAGHSELSIAISEEKNVYEMGVKLIAAKTDGKSLFPCEFARSQIICT